MFAQNFALEVCVVSHTPQETLVRPQRVSGGEDYSDLLEAPLERPDDERDLEHHAMAAPPYFNRKRITRSMVGT